MSRESFNLFRGELLGAKMYTALKALSTAEEAHEGVMRKDGVTPYIEHAMKVASILFDLGITDEEVIATALLHDVIEDSKDHKIKSRIYNEFSGNIGLASTAVSKNKVYPTTDIKKDWIMVKKELIPIYWLGECYCSPEDYIEFDNFENLIEVGDLVVVEDDYTNIKIKTNFQIVTNIKNRIIETRDYFSVNKIVFEIWKRVANTFIRVAHKIDNEWVID